MIFLKLEYAGQNGIGGLNPKIFWVIFFQPLLLDSKHGALERSKTFLLTYCLNKTLRVFLR
jgi:hypothetical protein